MGSYFSKTTVDSDQGGFGPAYSVLWKPQSAIMDIDDDYIQSVVMKVDEKKNSKQPDELGTDQALGTE